MGDIAIDVFMATLKNLITSSNYLDFSVDEKRQLQSLADEIKYLGRFLKIAENKRKEQAKVMNLVMRIRDVVSEAENIVELYVALVFKANHASDPLLNPVSDPLLNPAASDPLLNHASDPLLEHRHLSLDLDSVRREIQTLMTEVKQIYTWNLYGLQNLVAVEERKHSSAESGGSLGRSRLPKVVERNVAVGFKKEVENVTRKLHDSGDGGQLEIISIISEGGVGKTTLAREVYNQRLTSEVFEIRAWVVIPEDYNSTMKRDLLFRILKSAFPEKHEDYRNNSEGELADELLKCLKDKKYLIVMDDIWSIEAWNDVQIWFPKRCNGSKVMFTSRLPVQPNDHHIRYVPHKLGPLTESCGWELLEKKVFGKKPCPVDLVEIGKQIALKCGGLALSIIVVAGILATEEKTVDVWQKVSDNLTSISGRGWSACIELSYNYLPLPLKACFLYIGAHPEDYQIKVQELIWLWIAEGFIQQSEGGESLETVAEGYLINLIDRNLVMVRGKNKCSGEINKCYMLDLLRDFCITKAREDKFFAQLFRDHPSSVRAISNCPRLFVAHHVRHMISSLPFAQDRRSFSCFDLAFPERPSQEQNLSFFSKKFILLKVLNFIPAKSLEEIGLGDLVHLRYLAIKPEDSYLVHCFHFLPNLETFILHDNGADFSLPLDILKMIKLRHLYSNSRPFHFHDASYDENTGNMLDSLHTLVPMCSCPRCLRFLKRTPNLKQIGLVQEGLDPHNDLMLPDLEYLKCLERLTVRGRYQIKRVATTRLKLPLTLTWLTLINTNLKWDEVSIILQKMSSLQTLQLLIGACEGQVWDTSKLKETFSRLKCLELSSLDIQKWNASEDQFPILEVLVIECCANLRGIPIKFADRHQLREIKVKMSSQYVMKSARKIWIKQRNIKGDDDCLNLIFYDGSATNVDGDDDDDDGKRTMMMTEISHKMQCKQMMIMIEGRRR